MLHSARSTVRGRWDAAVSAHGERQARADRLLAGEVLQLSASQAAARGAGVAFGRVNGRVAVGREVTGRSDSTIGQENPYAKNSRESGTKKLERRHQTR